MNYRINTKVAAVVALLLVFAAGLFTYILVSKSDQQIVEESQTPKQQVAEQIITARHQFKDGIHTIAGTVAVPTPCHRIIAEPFLLNAGATAEVRFSTLMEGAECPNTQSDASFKVTFTAREDVVIQATWDGVPVRINLIPLSPGESIEDEVYNKG